MNCQKCGIEGDYTPIKMIDGLWLCHDCEVEHEEDELTNARAENGEFDANI